MPVEADVREFLDNYLSFIPQEYWALIALVVIFGWILIKVLNPILLFWNSIQVIRNRTIKKNIDGERAVVTLRPEIRVLRDVWLKDREPNSLSPQEPNYPDTKVISILNMKGGVGKTTLTSNLAAALGALQKKVLIIDYDYQGTLSLMVAGAVEKTRRDIGAGSYLTLYPASPESAASYSYQLGDKLGGAAISGASYQLFRDEMEQFAKWSAAEVEYDVRTQLREFLQASGALNKYDIVLIDCGPRFTTSTINALCASTHFIVPTILDEASSQAAVFLDKEISAHQAELFPKLKLVGVVPTFVKQDPRGALSPTFNSTELEQLDVLTAAFKRSHSESAVMRSARIPIRSCFSNNADRIAYFEHKEAVRIFDRLAEQVLERLGQ